MDYLKLSSCAAAQEEKSQSRKIGRLDLYCAARPADDSISFFEAVTGERLAYSSFKTTIRTQGSQDEWAAASQRVNARYNLQTRGPSGLNGPTAQRGF